MVCLVVEFMVAMVFAEDEALPVDVPVEGVEEVEAVEAVELEIVVDVAELVLTPAELPTFTGTVVVVAAEAVAVNCQVESKFGPPQTCVEFPLHLIEQLVLATLPLMKLFPQ